MNYKIAYIELDTHPEIVQNFMELMNDSKVFSVDYYFSEKILKQLGLQENSTIFKVNHQNIYKKILINTQPTTNNYELVIIGTVHRYFNIFEIIAEKFNTAIICHNLNFVKISSSTLFFNIFKNDFKYQLKLLLKEGLLRKSKVYQKAKNWLVLDQSFSNYQLKYFPIFYNKFSTISRNKIFTAVIPGAVSQKRRDYISVIQKFKNLNNEDSISKFARNEIFVENTDCNKPSCIRTTENFEIIFLGKAQGKELEMLQDFEKTKPDYISIKYFTEKIPQHIFDEYMQKADVLWCPIQQETEFFSQKEFYGKTKMSGNIGDAIKYSKTAVFPKNYPSNYPFIVKEEENIFQQIFNLKKEKTQFIDFQRDKILQKLEKTLIQLIS